MGNGIKKTRKQSDIQKVKKTSFVPDNTKKNKNDGKTTRVK